MATSAPLDLLPVPKRSLLVPPVVFSGSVKLMTWDMDEGTFVDFHDASNHQVFMYCWADHKRGEGTHVDFATPGAWGHFALSLPIRDQDTDLLKIMCCMRMLDEESNNYRTITFASSAAQLDKLMAGKEQTLTMRDPVMKTNYARVTLCAKNATAFRNHPNCKDRDAPKLVFTRSSLWDVGLFNQEVVCVSEFINANSEKNGMGMPPGGGQFSLGLSGWEWGGAEFEDSCRASALVCADFESPDRIYIPPLQTHYALMGAQEESLDRLLPVALVVYHLYLKLHHSGMAMDAALRLSDLEFAQFFAQALQITCDAGLTPYERDFVPGLALSFTRGITIQATGTENMVCPVHC